MKGRLRPKFDLHRSLSDPINGVRKKPTIGDKHQIRVMCLCSTPETDHNYKLIGETILQPIHTKDIGGSYHKHCYDLDCIYKL